MTLALVAAGVCFCALWIAVPAPNSLLLPLAVGAPEISPLLFAVSLVVLFLGLRTSTETAGQVAAALAVTAACLCALPILQIPGVVRRFDEALPPTGGSAVRERPLSVSALVRGPAAGDARVTRGIQFASPDGFALTLDVYQPRSAGRVPILVQIYGGAWQRGAPGDNAAVAKYFASRGYVVFAIDYRHAPRWQRPTQIEDVRAALAWIRRRAAEYDGDPDRIALIGRSSGAQLALVAAYETVTPGVAAVVSYYGPTDLE